MLNEDEIQSFHCHANHLDRIFMYRPFFGYSFEIETKNVTLPQSTLQWEYE